MKISPFISPSELGTLAAISQNFVAALKPFSGSGSLFPTVKLNIKPNRTPPPLHIKLARASLKRFGTLWIPFCLARRRASKLTRDYQCCSRQDSKDNNDGCWRCSDSDRCVVSVTKVLCLWPQTQIRAVAFSFVDSQGNWKLEWHFSIADYSKFDVRFDIKFLWEICILHQLQIQFPFNCRS